MEIRNYGSTPARVLNLILACKILEKGEAIPSIPPYGDEIMRSEAFLVKGDFFSYSETLDVGLKEAQAIESGDKIFLVFGYVEYVDVFETQHRAGYGRTYLEGMPMSREAYDSDEQFETRSNLAYIQQRGYNYDKKHKV